jgi:hypothetical protein
MLPTHPLRRQGTFKSRLSRRGFETLTAGRPAASEQIGIADRMTSATFHRNIELSVHAEISDSDAVMSAAHKRGGHRRVSYT